jgi:hypothetical protein
MRSLLVEQKLRAMIYLPEIPGVPDGYADLRLITAIPTDLLATGNRICSMTEPARERLRAQLVAFFLRKELPA